MIDRNSGESWSEGEIDLIVADYFAMLADEWPAHRGD